MKEMSKLREILKNPPTKSIKCRRCDGDGYINPRGMITSDKCPVCQGSYNDYKERVKDHNKWEQQILETYIPKDNLPSEEEIESLVQSTIFKWENMPFNRRLSLRIILTKAIHQRINNA